MGHEEIGRDQWTPHALGFCRERGHRVTNGDCKACYWQTHGRPSTRDMCIAINVTRDEGEITGNVLARLPESSVRAILGNALMVAQGHPGEITAKCLMQEVRLHLSFLEKTPCDTAKSP